MRSRILNDDASSSSGRSALPLVVGCTNASFSSQYGAYDEFWVVSYWLSSYWSLFFFSILISVPILLVFSFYP
jgi:hypothetical protein